MSEVIHEGKRNFDAIPAAACQFAGGEVSIGDNGERARTAPVKIKARSGKPLEHWFWGRVVHDLAGMRLGKPRLPIDYAHNDSEVLGYLNHFDSASGDLIASGALIPFCDGDRASEVLFKMREGIPYEASIFFGGDGIKVQEVGEGELSPVNGYDFEGPGVIIREWPLRGVAICPYGADANTESAALSKGPSFAATRWTSPTTGEQTMSDEATAVDAQVEPEAAPAAVDQLAVEAEADAVENPTATEADVVQAVVEPVAQATELDAAVADALRARLCAVEADNTRLSGECAGAVQRAESAEASLATVTAERDASIAELTATAETLRTVSAERDDARDKLAVIQRGALPVSAVPAKEDDGLTPWQKAQKRRK